MQQLSTTARRACDLHHTKQPFTPWEASPTLWGGLLAATYYLEKFGQ